MESAASTSTASFGLAALGQIGITVTDVDRAVAFYRDALGMKFLFQFPNMGFFDCNGVRLMLSVAERPSETYSSILYFKVSDIQEAHRTMAARGVAFEGEPHLIAKMPDHDLWMAFFADPDGHILALMHEAPKGYAPQTR